MLASALSSHSFVVTAELGPPRDPDPDLVRAGARALVGSVDAVNITDNQAATVKLSPVACSALLIDEGVDPILQITGRDRNVMALQSELLGAWALGVRTVLTLTGDPLRVGPYEGIATAVGDLDSLGLARLIVAMNAGRLAADEPLEEPTSFLVAGAANPLVDSVERLEGKLAAGVGLLQSNIVYDVERFAAWLAPFVEAGITERAPLLVGIAPPRSSGMLTYMHERIPGVEVDDATFARMKGRSGDDATTTGIEIAAELVQRVREVPGVSGVHLMAPGWESVAVPAVVRAAGLETRAAGSAPSTG
jgi:5,10-methylenetetrahydrofolate reductase